MSLFFSISYSFIRWMFKTHRDTYVFNMTDDEFPNYRFKVTVERIKENE